MISEKEALNYLRELMIYLGDTPDREGTLKTPKRILNSWKKLYGGYKQNPKDVLTVFDSDGYGSIVLLKNIEFYSTCEHHMLPFIGKAHVAYIPDKKVIGVSKLARIVEIYARRLQIQERLTNQVATAIEELLHPLGVGVVMEAQHLCMKMRGVEKQNSVMVTSTMLGVFREDSKAREELMNLLK